MATTTGSAKEAASADLRDLKRKSVRGGLITMVSQGISVSIQLVSTVALARMLAPADYGIVAMVTTITAFAGIFRDLGLSSAVIQKDELTHAQMSNLFWLNTAMGALLTLLMAAISPAVAWFYGRPELVKLTLLLSTTFFLGSLGTQHGALMQRDLQFARRAVATVAGSLATLVIAMMLAWRGYGYWSLAWGNVAGVVVTTVLLFALSSFRAKWWTNGAGIDSMLKFGAHLTVFDVVNFFQRNSDNILIGRYWGGEALGFYNRAYQLLMFPISNIRGPINAVAFPVMSRLQDQPDALRAYYLKVTSMIALVTMPMVAFFWVESAVVIELALGRQWLDAVPIFAALALAGFIQPAFGFIGSLMLSMGRGKTYAQCGIFNSVILVSCIVIGLPWGGQGVAWGYAIGNYVILYPSLRWVYRGTKITVGDFTLACGWPVLLSVVSVGAVLEGERLLPVSNDPLYKLSFAGVVFVSVLIAGIFLNRRMRNDVMHIRMALRA